MAKQSTTGVMTRLLILYLAMTVAYAFLRQPIGTAILNQFVDQRQVKQSQAKMKEFQKVYREAQLSGDKGKLKKLEDERAEVMQLSMDIQAQTMKPMPYILIISLPLFAWLSYIVSPSLSTFSYVSKAITFPWYPLPITVDYTAGVILGFPVWLVWYLICSLVFTQVIRKTLGM
jgi:uncharacterized membrane protein (DUF106 family)